MPAAKRIDLPDRGYIRLYRSIFDHPVFRPEPLTEREAWTWLCASAAWKPRQQRLGEHLINLGRGEVIGAVRYLASEWQWSKGKVERFLDRLKNEHMVETKTGTGITVITVCNYDYYQGGEDGDGTEPGRGPGQSRDAAGTEPGRGRDRAGTIEKNSIPSRIEEREEIEHAPDARRAPVSSRSLFDDEPAASENPGKKKRRSAATRKTKLDPNWELPEAGLRYARDRGWNDNHIRYQFDKFKNHHIGKGNLWADWLRAWYTWVGNDYDRQRTIGGRSPAPSRADTAIEGMMRDLTEEDYFARDR